MRTSLKILIFTTIGLSLAAILFPQISSWLILSRQGIEHLFLWQLFTYILIEPGPFSFGFALQLAFNMYILYLFGASILERCRPRTFFSLYFGSALFAALASLAFPHAILAGSTNAVYAIMVAWMMLHSGAQLLLFFALPFKAHYLIGALVAFTLFMDLSNANWVGLTATSTSVLYGYLFSLIAWRERSPFPFLYPFERRLFRLLEKKQTENYHSSKIYDIKSGNPILSDDQFMDAMLDQISRLGEQSLTAAQKKRMKEISEKKK
jgi:membrane associated rhomboid family serine protease